MRKKVLLVEDDVILMSSLQAKLSVEGCEVEAANGTGEVEELIKFVLLNKPDLIILDLILPKIDGFEILKKIKEDSEISSIPVFIFTNLGDQDSRSKGDFLGADFYFLKTELNTDQLIEKIKKIFINKEKLL